jgi:hypothetical protein
MGVLLSVLLASQISFDHCPIGLRFFDPDTKALIDDAMERWEKKLSGFDPELKERCPVIIEIEDKKCVKLQKIVISIGEDPVYCYNRSGKLLKSYDNVD